MDRRERRRSRWKNASKPSAGVNLISMMDILTVLLLFLLKSYVADGEVMVPPKGVTLPTSNAQSTPQTSLVVAIDGDAIKVGDETVASLADVSALPGMEIPGLSERLQAVRQEKAAAGADSPVTKLATIQGDREIEYHVLRKVMYTLSANGWENVSLAVLRNT